MKQALTSLDPRGVGSRISQCRAAHPADPADGEAVVILAYYFPPENAIGADRPFRFAKYLPRFGFVPRVIANNAGESREIDSVARVPRRDRHSIALALAARAARAVQRLLPYNEQLAWAPHAVAAGSRVIDTDSARLVLSTSPPLATHLAALRLKQRLGTKWIADFRDPLMGNPCRTRKFGKVYDGALERCIFGHADFLIANTESTAEIWRERYPQWAGKIRTIWNCFDPEEVLRPLVIPRRPQALLAHVGSIYGLRDPRPVLSAVERSIAQGWLNPAALQVLFAGPLEERLFSLADPPFSTLAAKGCFRCENRLLSRPEARRLIAAADYLLLIDHASAEAAHVPAKLFEYIQVGRPILALTSRNSPCDQILAKAGVPYKCIYMDASAEQASACLQEFLSLPNRAVHASRWFWEQFDGTRQTETLASLFRSLLAS